MSVVFPWSTWPIVPMLTWGLFRSYFPRAARTVRARRRWEAAAEDEEGVWRKRFAEDLATKVEESSNLVEGFGRVKIGDDDEEEDEGVAYVKDVAAVAAAEIEAMGGVFTEGGREGRR